MAAQVLLRRLSLDPAFCHLLRYNVEVIDGPKTLHLEAVARSHHRLRISFCSATNEPFLRLYAPSATFHGP